MFAHLDKIFDIYFYLTNQSFRSDRSLISGVSFYQVFTNSLPSVQNNDKVSSIGVVTQPWCVSIYVQVETINNLNSSCHVCY